jgi:hypothetical protein
MRKFSVATAIIGGRPAVRSLILLPASVLVLIACPVVGAQPIALTPLVEISAALSMVTPSPEHAYPRLPSCSSTPRPAGPCSTPATFPNGGWAVSVAHSVNRWLGLAAEVAGYDNDEFPGGLLKVNHVRSFMAGPRVVFQRRGKGTAFFGQVFAGRVRSNVLGGDYAIQPGGGLDFPATGPVAVRFELDYCLVSRNAGNLSAPRALLGIIARLGSLNP